MARSIDDQHERTLHIHKDVFAFGLALFPSEHLKKMCRTNLAEMEAMDYAEVPYSLGASMFETLEVYIRKNLSYLGQSKIVEFDRARGVIKPTELGGAVIKRLADRIRKHI